MKNDPFDAVLFDGTTGHPHPVRVAVAGDRFELTGADDWAEVVPASDLERVDAPLGKIRLGCKGRPGWRLQLDGAQAPLIDSAVGKASPGYGRWIDRIGLWRASAAFGIVAVTVLLVGHAAPHWIAPHIPPQWERNLGTALVGDFGEWRCTNRRGATSLAILARRIDPQAMSGEDRVRLWAISVPIYNAAAIPGRQVVLFGDMVKEAKQPDALAGVLAHELAHVRRRHVTEALIRELGIGALIRLFAGDIGANAEQLVSLSYTRANEEEADRDAIAMLKSAGIDPRPTGALFRKLDDEEGHLTQKGGVDPFLRSHPVTIERAKAFEASFDPKATYRPALSPTEAAALAGMCEGDGKR